MAIKPGVNAYLIAQSDTFRKEYAPGISDQMRRFGKTTALINLKSRELDNSRIEYELKSLNNRSSRLSRDVMAPMPDPGIGQYTRFFVNFDHTSPEDNDFMAIEVAFRTTFVDIEKRMAATWKGDTNYLDSDVEDGLADVKETFAKCIHLPADGKLATVATGGKLDDDTDLADDASAYVNGSTTCLIKLDATSIARIGHGQMIEFRTAGGTLVVNNILVTDVHPFYNTINVKITADSVDSAGTAVTNLDNVAAADQVFLSGNYNVSASGTLDGFFNNDLAYYGKTRNGGAGVNDVLKPRRIDASRGGALVDLTDRAFQDVGRVAGWQLGDGNAKYSRAVVMSRNETDGIRSLVKNGAFRMEPILQSQINGDIIRATGHDGFVIHDTNLGTILHVEDDFAEPGKIDLLDMKDWEMVVPNNAYKDLYMFEGTHGMWTRETESDGSGKPSKYYSANGIKMFAFVCTRPLMQTRLMGLKTNM